MSAADKAIANTLQFECKKDALRQVQSGDWKLSFTVASVDVPDALLTAPMGTRYQAVIVEIGDDEQPVEQPKPANKHKLSQQAAMLCEDKLFAKFMGEEVARLGPVRHELTTLPMAVRHICQVKSRSEFDTNSEAAARWRKLKGDFEGWKITT